MNALEARDRLLALCPVGGVLPVDVSTEDRQRLTQELRDYLDKQQPPAFIPQWLLSETKHHVQRKAMSHTVSEGATVVTVADQTAAMEELEKGGFLSEVIDLVKDAGGWEAGPRGGTRRKLSSGKWQYKRGSSGGREKSEKTDDAKGSEDHGDKSMDAVAQALDKLPDGWSIETEAGEKFTKKEGKWHPAGSSDSMSSDEWVDKETDKDGGKEDEEKKKFNGSKLKWALWAFMEGFVPGNDPNWKVKAEKFAGHKDKDKDKDKADTKDAEKAEEDKADDKPKPERHPDAPKGFEPDPKSSNNAHVDAKGRKWYPPPKEKKDKPDETKKGMSYSDVLKGLRLQIDEARRRR